MKIRLNVTVYLARAADDDESRERFRKVKRRLKAMDSCEIAKLLMAAVEREETPKIGFKA